MLETRTSESSRGRHEQLTGELTAPPRFKFVPPPPQLEHHSLPFPLITTKYVTLCFLRKVITYYKHHVKEGTIKSLPFYLVLSLVQVPLGEPRAESAARHTHQHPPRVPSIFSDLVAQVIFYCTVKWLEVFIQRGRG